MNILLTYDYELFFGDIAGTPERCILQPTRRILEVLDLRDAKATFYVDVGYLARCRDLAADMANHDRVVNQVRQMASRGHDIQLHIHPHWEDSVYRDGTWSMNTVRYRLHDFSQSEATELIRRYAQLLEEIAGRMPIAFRAGGWCLQPFDHVADALFDVGVRVESTVFRGGYNHSNRRPFDFRDAPEQDWWQFEHDPLDPTEGGRFVELPITARRVAPTLYWRLALTRLCGRARHTNWGDGHSVPQSRAQTLALMLLPSYAALSLDGYKASLLWDAYQRTTESGLLVAVGHPKAQTEYSIRLLQRIVRANPQDDFITTTAWWERSKQHGRIQTPDSTGH